MHLLKKIIFILIILNLVLTGNLFFSSLNAEPGICLTGDHSCETVQQSEYGEIFGFKVGTLGFLSFAILTLIFFLDYKQKIHKQVFPPITLLGAIGALYFIFLQLFVLKQICSICMVIDTTMILIFILTLISYKKKF